MINVKGTLAVLTGGGIKCGPERGGQGCVRTRISDLWC